MDHTDPDPLDDPAMAMMLRSFAARVRSAGAPRFLSPARRAALRAQLDAIDAEFGRGPAAARSWRAWVAVAAAAALLVLAVTLALRSGPGPLPHIEASVARAEAVRGAPRSSAFTVDVEGREPGCVRIYAFTRDGQRHALALNDGSMVASVTRRTHFGEFDLPDAWQLVVVFSRQRETLRALDAQVPASLRGASAAERLREVGQVVEALHGMGIAALALAAP